eukprot:scaffold17956_cov69-Skeletonema_menzelii.AAC.1
MPKTRTKKIKFISWSPTAPLGECEGDCDGDRQCAGDLICHKRDANEEVPGCSGGGSDESNADYCTRLAADTASPTMSSSPTSLPTTAEPTPPPTTAKPEPTPPQTNDRPTSMPKTGTKKIKFI